jgi:hypothetical protein
MVVLVGDVLDGVVVVTETDGRCPRLPLEFAGNALVGVAAREVPAVLGGCFGCAGKIERVADFDDAARGGFRAHGDVVSARKRVAMGGGDMDGEEDEEEDGETWLVSSHGGEKTRWVHGFTLIWLFS